MARGRSASRILLAAALLAPFAAAARDLGVGDAAPNVLLLDSDGTVVTLEQLLDRGGSEGILLAWFPKAFTPG